MKEFFMYTENGKIYDINKIHEIVKKKYLFGKYISINKFVSQLNSNVWDIGVSPLQIMNDPDYNNETRFHMNRILEVDSEEYSIYVSENFTVIDGYHRLCKAKLEGKKYIKAIKISEEILEMCFYKKEN